MCSSKRCLQSMAIIMSTDKQIMEQNQVNQGSTDEQQWTLLRQQYAQPQQSINDEQAIQLLEQWIKTKCKDQFSTLNNQSQNPEGTKNLKDALREAIAAQKESNYVISQRYGLPHAQQLIQKVKQIYQQYSPPPQTQPPLPPSRKSSAKSHAKRSLSNHSEHSERQVQNPKLNISTFLPQIKPKGKLYNSHQLSSSYQLLQQTVQQYKPRSPHLFQRDHQAKAQIRQNLLTNKFLKQAFYKFCKQSYNYKGLFDQFFNEGDKMNLNKWMVFCKQFDFNEKFHQKDLIEFYQNATHFASKMDLQQFLIAVVMLQQKYIQRFHTGEQFVEDILKINSQAAFKVKMQNLKVSYSGPKRNSFQNATYIQPLRFQEKEREKQFERKKKKRQLVLIQGMYEEHLKSQVERRKQIREQNKLTPRTSSLGYSMTKQNASTVRQNVQSVQRKTHIRPEDMNYSKIFQITKNPTPRKTTQLGESAFPTTAAPSMYKTENKSKVEIKYNQSKVAEHTLPVPKKTEPQKKIEQKEVDASARRQPQRQWGGPAQSTWLTRLRSDSEQSDQILKEHLEIEKKIMQSRQSLKVNNLKIQMAGQAARVQSIKKEMEIEDDLAQTQALFVAKRQHHK